MATKFTSATQNAFKLVSPEIKALPLKWTASYEDQDPCEIFYTGPPDKNGQKKRTFTHPYLGPLPKNWKLCYYLVDKKANKREPRYVNTKTKEAITDNPRFLPETLKAMQNQKAPCMQTRVGSSVLKNKPGLIQSGYRAPIGTDPSLRDKYEKVHVIDDGGGELGGMNGGVFVVRVKGLSNLYVEKRFKSSNWDMVKREVELMHRCRHGGITLFCAAFVDDLTMTASLITEFCDRGSWDNLITKYQLRRAELISKGIEILPIIPEQFLWHAFLGIADAFAYLQGGRSYLHDPIEDEPAGPVKGWISIIHRDMKPDNVLMRARSTLTSNKYFYCMLTDFGVACEDNGTDDSQNKGWVLGTQHYQPPELLWDPYPKGDQEHNCYPPDTRHSSNTDIWSLGICIFNLAQTNPPMYKTINEQNPNGIIVPYPHANISHLCLEDKPDDVAMVDWIHGRGSHTVDLSLPGEYSDALNQAVLRATSYDRPGAIQMVKELKYYVSEAGIKGTGPRRESERLPDWCVTVPDFYAKMDL